MKVETAALLYVFYLNVKLFWLQSIVFWKWKIYLLITIVIGISDYDSIAQITGGYDQMHSLYIQYYACLITYFA
jgi:hypothetical protein